MLWSLPRYPEASGSSATVTTWTVPKWTVCWPPTWKLRIWYICRNTTLIKDQCIEDSFLMLGVVQFQWTKWIHFTTISLYPIVTSTAPPSTTVNPGFWGVFIMNGGEINLHYVHLFLMTSKGLYPKFCSLNPFFSRRFLVEQTCF